MKEYSERYVERFIDGELTTDDLRRAIELTLHDEWFRSRVCSAITMQNWVRRAYADVYPVPIGVDKN